MKKPNQKSQETKKTKETINVRDVEVSRVRQTQNGTVFFTLELNGVIIYDCRVVEGKNGDFVAFPSDKGSDDKYYSKVYAPLSEEDAKAIISEVEKQLNS